MAAKYKDYFNQMFSENRDLFHQFMVISQQYSVDKSAHQVEFNRLGQTVTEIIRDWERRLCRQMEKGKNSVFSARLADKFWAEVRKFMPLIDLVGVEIIKADSRSARLPTTSKSSPAQDNWLDRKINLS